MAKNFNYPDKAAKKLANDLKAFRAKTELTAYSEINPHADSDRREVVKQIDWSILNTLIEQLSYTYDQRMKYGRGY